MMYWRSLSRREKIAEVIYLGGIVVMLFVVALIAVWEHL